MKIEIIAESRTRLMYEVSGFFQSYIVEYKVFYDKAFNKRVNKWKFTIDNNYNKTFYFY